MVNVMELQKQLQRWQQQQSTGNANVDADANANGELMYVKVMTDEQLETLRKQIAVYGTICEQLIEMHRTLSAQQDLAGARLGNVYCDPLMTSGGHKITSRQRWTPTPVQLQILERIFDQGNGTPSKEKIKEITAELGQHGQISETNVYNWFQNRRARSKRKLQNVASSNTESEVDTEVDSKDKKTKSEDFQSQLCNITTSGEAEKLCFQNPQVYSDLHYLSTDSSKPYSMFQSDDSLKSTRNLSHTSAFNEVLSNSRNEYVGGKMDVVGTASYHLFQQAGDCNLTG